MLWQSNSYIFSISTEVFSYVFRKKLSGYYLQELYAVQNSSPNHHCKL